MILQSMVIKSGEFDSINEPSKDQKTLTWGDYQKAFLKTKGPFWRMFYSMFLDYICVPGILFDSKVAV